MSQYKASRSAARFEAYRLIATIDQRYTRNTRSAQQGMAISYYRETLARLLRWWNAGVVA